MTHTLRCFGGKEIGGRRLEELEHCRVFERGRVRHVDDDVGTVEGGGHALAGERVDARVRRCRHGLMALFSKVCDDLRPDAPGSADDDDLHGVPPCCRAHYDPPLALIVGSTSTLSRKELPRYPGVTLVPMSAESRAVRLPRWPAGGVLGGNRG